jgi:exosome complex exonuclease DIS3/RRP44
MEEVKHRNLSLYNRLHVLIKDESRHFIYFANEHHRETYVDRRPHETPNDRAIRVATAWYKSHLPTSARVRMVTNDRANLELAKASGLDASTIFDFVGSIKQVYPELVDPGGGWGWRDRRTETEARAVISGQQATVRIDRGD